MLSDTILAPASPSRSRIQARLDGLQAGRGIAAILVVLYHSGRMVSLPQYVGHIPLRNMFGFGHAGVDFFFVLSGFIIIHVHRADLGHRERLAHYALKRIMRVVPMYWAVTGFVILFSLLKSDRAGIFSFREVALSLFLIPHATGPLLGVAWTLEQEAMFYVAFGLAILWRPIGATLAVLAVLTSGVALWHPFPPNGGGVSTIIGNAISSPYHLHFLLGCGVALLAASGRIRRPRTLLFVGAAIFLMAGYEEDIGVLAPSGGASRLILGLSSAMMVAGLVEAERQAALHPGRFLLLLGAASYSIYLGHALTIGFAVHFLAMTGLLAMLPGWSIMLTCAAAGVAFGIALYQFAERPLSSAVTNLMGRFAHCPEIR